VRQLKKNILASVFFLSCVYFIGCCASGNKVADAIAKKCRAGDGTVINISDITDYSWERMYIFGPYANGKSIQTIVGQDFLAPREIKRLRRQGLLEFESMFVFIHGERVVDHFIFSMAYADFTIFKGFNDLKVNSANHDKQSFAYLNRDNFSCFTPSTAKFRINSGKLELIKGN
jgi:hypothetical protein